MEDVKGVEINWLTMLTSASLGGLIIYIVLILMCIATWGVIIERYISLSKSYKNSMLFRKSFWEVKSLSDLHVKSELIPPSPALELFRSGYNEMVRLIQVRDKIGSKAAIPLDTVKRALMNARKLEEGTLSKGFSFLAISSSAGPFIGLLGTVLVLLMHLVLLEPLVLQAFLILLQEFLKLFLQLFLVYWLLFLRLFFIMFINLMLENTCCF